MSGAYIIVLQVVNVPPHLLIAVNGRSWSISVSGQLPAEPLEKLFSYIHRKQVPTIFTELLLPEGMNADSFCESLDAAVAKYPEVHANTISCLAPIRDAAATVFGDPVNSAQFIFELIPAIQKANGIGEHSGFYLDGLLDAEHHLAMRLYTAEDVAQATMEAAKQFSESKG